MKRRPSGCPYSNPSGTVTEPDTKPSSHDCLRKRSLLNTWSLNDTGDGLEGAR